MICLNSTCLPGGICVICMICTCFAGWDRYDLDLVHTFTYLSVKKDIDDLQNWSVDRDLSYCRCETVYGNPPGYPGTRVRLTRRRSNSNRGANSVW